MFAVPSLSRRPFAAALALLALAACSGDTTNVTTVVDPGLGIDDPLPGVVLAIESVTGGSLPSGNARAGDRLTITFSLRDDDGNALALSTFASGQAFASGPTFDYQRVLAAETDVVTRSVRLGAGRYAFSFANALPATYLAPLHDSGLLTDGERTGESLLAGTYTVCLSLKKQYTIDGTDYDDVGTATKDFLVGSASEIEPRAVVATANCTQCHGELRAHDAFAGPVESCLLCHTAGAEDRSGLGRSIEFRVMLHKVHAGRTLPSVQGVATQNDGTRTYVATPVPYQLLGETLHDWSDVHFPVWPSMSIGMPRDTEYATIGSTAQAIENVLLTGPVSCASCHGDPDGAGPLDAPEQGDLIESQLTRRACASCHDDWDPTKPYISNGQPMPPQTSDSDCLQCHDPSNATLGVPGAHTHPLTDSTFATGVNVAITATADEGGDGDGTLDAGEFLRLDFTVQDDAGNAIAAASLARLEAVLSGPTANPNLLNLIRIAPTTIGAGPTFSTRLPEQVALEYVGDSTGALDAFQTARGNHRNATGALTYVFVETATGSSTTLASAATAGQNTFEVTSVTGFAAGDWLRLDSGADREWVQIRRVSGTTLYLSSRNNPTYGSGAAARPIAFGLAKAHAAGVAVTEVTLTEVPSSSFGLTTSTGAIAENVEFGTGAVLVSYTTDWQVPATYPGALNESPDLDASHGKWTSLSLLSGTYSLYLTATRSRTKTVGAVSTSYTEASPPERADLLFGSATTIELSTRLSDYSGCAKCHVDLQFHGGSRRGFDDCLACHGTAGGEDAPTYVYPSAASTTGTAIEFRAMLHAIHHGRELAAGADYAVVGFGGASSTYEHVGFPRVPGGTKDCASCHGSSNTAWKAPAARTHPDATVEARVWRAACASCHDSSAARAHVDANTSPSGAESCAICHGEGEEQNVERVHRAR